LKKALLERKVSKLPSIGPMAKLSSAINHRLHKTAEKIAA